MEEKRERLCRLLDCYGEALSARCRDVMTSYYADDLSLAEIAENCGITRQGVHDALRRGETELTAWEQALGLLEKRERLFAVIDRLSGSGRAEERALAGELTEILTGDH
ncbi:MAG: DNA-binding protein [Oscillospiraceae bacterium]|nr:DNA-binding protein [Oscillospiraceae bacterium]